MRSGSDSVGTEDGNHPSLSLATAALVLANGAATIVNGWQRDKVDALRIAQGLALHAGLTSEIFPRRQE